MEDELTVIEYIAKRRETTCPVCYTDCRPTTDGKLELLLADSSQFDYGGRQVLFLVPASRRDGKVRVNAVNISCNFLNGSTFKVLDGNLYHNSLGQCMILSFIRVS